MRTTYAQKRGHPKLETNCRLTCRPAVWKRRTFALRKSGKTMPMPTGRIEKRIARAVTVEICPEEEGMPKERTLTENVSPHGARVLMEREWRPGQQVMVMSPNEGVWARGQIVCCVHFAPRRCAVDLFRPVGRN